VASFVEDANRRVRRQIVQQFLRAGRGMAGDPDRVVKALTEVLGLG
jgi:hypothetical protein